jgi:hypothetical protein
MRPRFLLNLINQCKSFAINLNHEIISQDDIAKGLAAYSTDLLTDISYELNDIAGNVNDLLYAFIGSKSKISKEEVYAILIDFGLDESSLDEVFDLLLWYGFLGLEIDTEPKYIYNLNYSMQLLNGLIKKKATSLFIINPAFWSALMIED